MENNARFIPMTEGLNRFFDSFQKVIVEKRSNGFHVVGTDRRRLVKPVAMERRKLPSDNNSNFINLGNGLYYDTVQNTVMKKSGARLMLYCRDRRKTSASVPMERRLNPYKYINN